ncbi:MAG: ribonuclease E/G [Blautia sp.]|nr:ribonuclease E/G [Blautia sp.]
MKKLNRLIITEMDIFHISCQVCAYEEDGKIMELRMMPCGSKTILGNIYAGQVESISENIGAAFVKISPEERCYLQLKEAENAIFTSDRKKGQPLRPGDEILVQVSRDAMKGKLPSLSTNLNFTGKYLVLTTGNKIIGFSSKLNMEDKSRLSKWLTDEINSSDNEFGIIVRTNAADASQEEFFKEYEYLREKLKKTTVDGRHRTCFSCIYETESQYISAIRDANSRSLDEIITDVPAILSDAKKWLTINSPEEAYKLRFYQDKLLPLYKLYRLETALEEIQKEKIWLNSGGFLVIQQTEAFVSIDVNSGKFTEKKKMQETYRKINLEAAKEIARQLRLRNLSGIILIDFINMDNPDHQDELFHVLQKYLKKDPVKSKAVDITPLHILEMTRKKVRRPLYEDILDIRQMNRELNN